MKRLRLACATAIAPFLCTAAFAQDNQENDDETSATDRLVGTIVVTGTKKADAEDVQDVPIAVTAFGNEQLDALQFRDLSDIGSRVPNAIIDEIGTFKGVAAFSVRGQSSLSSIANVDPTVGTFIDGVYYGINAGIVFDNFDVASVEVLRGPQGLLFGRNVVGGAVLVNTTRPTDELTMDFRASVDSGLRGTGTNLTYSGVVSGPLTEGLNAKIAAYRNDDAGWFVNQFDGENFGDSETTIVRAALEWEATPNLTFLLRGEHGDQEGEGTAAQSHLNGAGNPGLGFSRNSHDLSINNRGVQESEWNQIFFETTLDVAFGDGVITNIFGYRDYEVVGCLDIDATPNTRFDSSCLSDPVGAEPVPIPDGGTDQRQYSNELRYAGRFGDVFDLTTGLYYFEQRTANSENRSLFAGAVRQSGGGIQNHQVFGVFANGDYDVSDTLTLSGGLRWTREEKDVKIASLGAPKPNTTPAGFCRAGIGECPFDFVDEDSWENIDFKVGFQYELSDSARFYGNWATGFRSGGYNFRNSDPAALTGAVDEESVDNFEIGFKTEPAFGATLNFAAFLTKTDDLQRIVITTGPLGPIQTGRNTADAEMLGFEIDGQFLLTDNLVFMGSFGYLDASYTDVLFDLSGDGVVDQNDLDLRIPRTAEITFSSSLIHEWDLGNAGSINTRLSFTYRDEQKSSDDNVAFLPSQEVLDLNIAWNSPSENIRISAFAKNILNDVIFTSDTQLPASLGSTYATFKKGGIFGIEARYTY